MSATQAIVELQSLDGNLHEAEADQVASSDFVTVILAGQMIGLPILSVRDIFQPQAITRVPLAPPEVAGSLNLRGRIVTAIDMRRRLLLEPLPEDAKPMSVVVEHDGELYSLIFDAVGDVMGLPDDCLEPNPATLEPVWRDISNGVYRLDAELLVVFDVAKILSFGD